MKHEWDKLWQPEPNGREDGKTHQCRHCGHMVEDGAEDMDGECSGRLGVY